MKPGKASEEAALAEIRMIYRELEARPFERQCARTTECCQFKRTGREPFVTRGEALLAARAFRATGRHAIPDSPDGACPMLNQTNGRCLIYEARPFGCRTHFCAAAGGPYARRDVLDLIRRLEAVDLSLGGDGSRRFQSALPV